MSRDIGGPAHLPVFALSFGSHDLVLEVLLRTLRPFQLALEFLLELLAAVLEVVEFGARLGQHVGGLEVLCAPVRAMSA